MGLRVNQRQIDAFRAECKENAANEHTFTRESSAVTNEVDETGISMWDYHFDFDGKSGNPKGIQESTYDIYDLFKAVSDEYEFESNGFNEFFVYQKD